MKVHMDFIIIITIIIIIITIIFIIITIIIIIIITIMSFRSNGLCEDYGEGSGANPEICEEVYVDEGQHSGSLTQDTNTQVAELYGGSNEGIL